MDDSLGSIRAGERTYNLRFVLLVALFFIIICLPIGSNSAQDAGIVFVDTPTNDIDGDTRSVTDLLADKGDDEKISFHEAIRAINNSEDDGYTVMFSLPFGSVIEAPGTTLTASNTIINGDMNGDEKPDIRLEHFNRLWGLLIRGDNNIVQNLVLEGIRLYGPEAHHNHIFNCYIGTDVEGRVWTTAIMHGIALHSGAHHNFIENNIIAGNMNSPFNKDDVMAGIVIVDAHENEIRGNWIGVNVDGEPLANDVGVIMERGSTKNIVGGNRTGSCTYPCNIISNHKANAIIVRDPGTEENEILGNYIGVGPDGVTAMGNGWWDPPNEPSHPGFALSCGASDNVFGGLRSGVECDGPCNVLSATESIGIYFFGPGTQRNRIQGNYIGLSADGSMMLPNWNSGIELDSYDSLNQCETISSIDENQPDSMERNRIGAIAVNFDEVNLSELKEEGTETVLRYDPELDVTELLSENLIGGERSGVACTGPCNVISGSTREGVVIYGADARENSVLGNYIGINPEGTVAMPNAYGVFVFGKASDNVIGGERAADVCDGPCNVISGNGFAGIALVNEETTGNRIQGNVIGMNPDVSEAIPNGDAGVLIWWSPSDNLVGGPRSAGSCRGSCNVIAGNVEQGVWLYGDERTTRNTIRGNAIYDNGGLGIDLYKEGVTYNDETDEDVGVNDLMNFPLSVSAVYDPNTNRTTVSATLQSQDAAGAVVDFYANEELDPSGHGEGQWYLGEGQSIGDGSFELSFEGQLEFHHVSATATNADGSTSEFGVRPPLVFIPGIAGSELQDGPQGAQLWPGVAAYHYDLSLYDEDSPSGEIYAPDVIREVIKFDFYKPLIDRLIDDGKYVEYLVEGDATRRTTDGCHVDQKENNPSLFIFAYDWRQSNEDQIQLLRDYVGCINKFYPGGKVDILAHSMGGLISRRYILEYPEDHQVNKLITAATPYLGAPNAIYVMETGDWGEWWMDLLIFPSTLKYIIGSFPGAHQLIPTHTYYTLLGGSPLIEEGWDLNKNHIPVEDYPYYRYKQVLDDRYGKDQFNPGTESHNFRAYPGLENWGGDVSGVDYYILYGVQDEEDDQTVGRVAAAVEIVCVYISELEPCKTKEVVKLKRYFTRGDGTVPVLGAVPPGASAAGASVVPFFGSASGGDKAIEHGRITNSQAVQDSVLAILSHGWDLYTVSGVGGVQADRISSPPSDRYYLTILGAEGYEVPEAARHFLLGDRADMILLPSSGTHTVIFETTDEPLAIEITKGTNTTATHVIRYAGISLPTGVVAKLVLSDQGVDDLQYDEDDDGTFESTVPPTISVSGPEADDLDPPQINVTVVDQGEELLVTLEAVDTGSGLRSLYYSLDGENFAPYTSGLNIDPEQTPFIYIFAYDNVLNRASLIYPTSMPDYEIYLPIVVKD